MPSDSSTRGRMGRIQGLPPEIKAYVDRRLREGATQAGIRRETAEMLADIDEPPLSAAGLNRYATRMEAVGRRFRESGEVAEAWVAKFGERPTGEVGQLLVQMLHTLAFETTLDAAEDGKGVVDADRLKDLALAAQRLERAAETGAKRAREVRREAAEVAVKAARAESKKQGWELPPEALKAIREQVYGLYDA